MITSDKPVTPEMAGTLELINTLELSEVLQATGTPALPVLLDRLVDLCDGHDSLDQASALAYLFGMLCCNCEGKVTQAEREGHLVSYDDRILLFHALAYRVYTEGLKLAQHPNCPTEPGQRAN